MTTVVLQRPKSQRAKNRIHEHGRIFEFIKEGNFNGQPAIYVRCICNLQQRIDTHFEGEIWTGWFTDKETDWEIK